MGRKPKYENPEEVVTAFFAAVSDSYRHPAPDEAVDGHKKQELVAEEFGISRIKVRKILITTGDLEYSETRTIASLLEQGMKMDAVCEKLRISPSTANSYLPYGKGVYKLTEVSAAAERTALYRSRKEAVEALNKKPSSIALWRCVCLFAGYPFMTAGRGKDRAGATKFTYSIPSSLDRRGGGRKYDGEDVDGFGNELFIINSTGEKREKGISRSSVEYAFRAVVENGGVVKGPKQLKIYGASYVYAMFLRFGLIDVGDGRG